MENLGWGEFCSKCQKKIYEKIKNEYSSEFNTMDYIDLYSSLLYTYENLNDYKRANFYNTLLQENNTKMYNEQLNDKVREIETVYKISPIIYDFDYYKKILHYKSNFLYAYI